MAAGFWAACYRAQPSRAVARAAAGAAAGARAAGPSRAYLRAVEAAQGAARRHEWLTRLLPGDPARLPVALAESIGLRALLKPATFPFKIWASYHLTVAVKRGAGKLRGGGGMGRGGLGGGGPVAALTVAVLS